MTLPPHVQAELAERGRRKLRRLDCPKCGAPVLVGLDSDRAGIPVVADAAPAAREARPGDYAVFDGELHHLDSPEPSRAPVHARHACGEA